MSTLSTFFKGSDTKLGIFYPTGYLLAVFADMDEAIRAAQALRFTGFAEDDVIAVSGEEVIQLAAEHKKTDGLWASFMQELSRVIGTEEVYLDRDLKLAARGAAFLLAYTPTEALKKEAWKMIEPLAPLMARHYETGGIEHLKGEV